MVLEKAEILMVKGEEKMTSGTEVTGNQIEIGKVVKTRRAEETRKMRV